MQAVILAAGMGKRLKELTRENTKCMVKVNGTTLIERMLRQIDRHGLKRVVIVVGYKAKILMDYISGLDIKTPITYITNEVYDRTNNIYSLALAREHLKEDDTLLFESDLIFEDSVLDLLINDKRDSLALVDKYESWMDGTCVTIGENDVIESFVSKDRFRFSDIKSYYKTVNIYKFSRDFSNKFYVPFLDAYQAALGENEYYEQVLRVITMLDKPAIQAKRLEGQKWYEIDDLQDLDIAESMFVTDEDKRVSLLQERYGGYWRYPRLIDYCYLVNPYFPPQKLMDEIKANFETLVTQYPSGMKVNSLLAAKNFGVKQEHIVVGNGAAELIKAVMNDLSGATGVVRPTFEEYSNRYAKDEIVPFWPENDDFSYTASDIIGYFGEHPVDNLVIINPDNPSGNYIPKKEIVKLIRWTDEKRIRFILDESFADFADEEDNSFIKDETLCGNTLLYVIKSISKSYGVPGLRLGVLASGDEIMISKMKTDVSIWNINSFAEFYMQIEEKYKQDYKDALCRFREERKLFVDELCKINGLRVIPTQANFVMAEITCGISAAELTRQLIINNNLLVKNLVAKMDVDGRQYIRLAIKTREENSILVKALSSVL